MRSRTSARHLVPQVPEVIAHFREELGDVLFQVFFHSVLAEEEGWFTLAEVAGGAPTQARQPPPWRLR